MRLIKGSKAAKAWGAKMRRLRRKNALRFGGSPRRRKSLRRYVKKYSGGKMRGARTALHSGIVRQLEHDVRRYKKRGLKAWLFGNRKLKNVQMGFKDGRGVFHPIRASKDYDEERSWSGALAGERKGIMREAMASMRGSRTGIARAKRAPLTYRQREDFAKQMYEARTEKRRAAGRNPSKAVHIIRWNGNEKEFSREAMAIAFMIRKQREGFRVSHFVRHKNPSAYAWQLKIARLYRAYKKALNDGHFHEARRVSGQIRRAEKHSFEAMHKKKMLPTKMPFERRRNKSKYSPAARKFISAFMRREMKGRKVSPKKRGQLLAIAMSKVRKRGLKVPPAPNPGGLAKVYDKVVSISTDLGLIKPQRKTAIYGDTRDRRRLVLKGERFNKQLEGAKVYEVEATGNTTKRNDVSKGDKFYHPFRVSAQISKDKAGHLVIRGSRPLWTPHTY